jgi:polar amino acid transport system substrate-binding protein
MIATTSGRRRGTRRTAVAAGFAVLLAGTVAGCSSSDKLAFCTDPSYPPAEFYQVAKVGGGTSELKRQLAGADIDIATEVAKRTGDSAEFVETSFSGIIDALEAKRCDAIISFMNDTAQRRQRLDFVDYLAAGQAVMTPKGGAAVTTVADLGGKRVSVAKDTTEEAFLTAANSGASAGQIKILSFSTENDAIYAVQKGAADAYFGDTPIVESAVAADSSLVLGGELVKPSPIGIALRKGDSRVSDVGTAVKDMYTDGTMGKILAKWKFTRYALTSP